MTTADLATARELRREIRDWRRGRAELKWGEVLSDAYVALFTVLMVGAMGGNVVLSLRRLADGTCGGTCAQVRSQAPWLAAVAVAVLALGVARLLGPVFSPPAANAWLLSTPVDRGALLRPGWWRAGGFTLVATATALTVPAVLGGFRLAEGVLFVVTGTSAALLCVGVAGFSQVRESPAARWLTWTVTGALWLLLGLCVSRWLATWQERFVDVSLHLLLLVALVAVAAAVVTFAAVRVAVAGMSRRVLAHTENLSPSLSGALSSLDFGLMYDVLLARRWGAAAHVRSRTGGPLGWWALVHRDLRRAGRTPQPFVLLAGLVLVPYAVAEADAGRAVVLATTLVGLLAGPPLCAGLRVVVRTQGLARMLPLSRYELVTAHLVVPGAALVAFGLATTWTLLPSMPAGEALTAALACGVSSLAATARWVTGKPPNYATPMLSTPLGGMPPGTMVSVLRGFDVWALTALPLMFGPNGVLVSMVISLVALGYLASDSPSRAAAG